MVAGSGREYTVRHEEWVLDTPVHESEVDKALVIMRQKAEEHDAPVMFTARDNELVIGFSYTVQREACEKCHRPLRPGRLHACRGPRLPHTHDPDGDGTDDCAACTVADDAREVRRADR